MCTPHLTHDCEPTGRIKYWCGRLLLGLTGWRVEGAIPPGNKFVLIGAPHTSNWDFPIGLAATYVYRLKISWMGKESLFRPPFSGIMCWLGGIAIDRSHPNGVVGQLANRLQQAESMVLMITPSGTRSQRDHWKSGFYWIAHKAQVPILCGYLDYKSKTVRIGPSFTPTGSIRQEMDRVRDFYRGVEGRHPSINTRIYLKEESNQTDNV